MDNRDNPIMIKILAYPLLKIEGTLIHRIENPPCPKKTQDKVVIKKSNQTKQETLLKD